MTAVKENIESMLNQISKGDLDGARETFQYVMTQKVSDELEVLKQSVGSEFMNNTQTEGVSYSAKKAAAGEDIGKPGKNFSKIASSAAKEYGSEEAGKRVAGSILAKLRAKKG